MAGREPAATDDLPVTEQSMGDRTAELAVLYSCVTSQVARREVKKHLTGADFYYPQHAALYDAMLAMDQASTPVDHFTLHAHVSSLSGPSLVPLVVDVASVPATPGNASEYARTVRGYALRRAGYQHHQAYAHRYLNLEEDPARLSSESITALTAMRDHGNDTTAVTMTQLLSQPDDTPTWVIPGLLESGDRLILTGTEGSGKSSILRQLSVMPAAGLHPFTEGIIPPIRTLIVDCENKPAQIRRQSRPLVSWLQRHSQVQDNPLERVMIDTPGRIDITRDRDLSRIHQTIDAWQPELVVMGPIYRMASRALNNDEDAAPFLAALDTITARGCALILEAHAGHSKDGVGKAQQRDLRPRGSSALLGWPEFGLGLRLTGYGIADLEPWRGHRETNRQWPTRVKHAAGNRWVETYPDDRGQHAPPPPPHDEGPRNEEAALWPAG